MKESSFYSDEFEDLIREKTEQYKMYPSENVWKGVHNSLHTKRKWFIGSMAFLVTGILFLSGRELIAPSARTLNNRKLAGTGGSSQTDGSGADLSKTNSAEDNLHSSFVRSRSANAVAASARRLNIEAADSFKGFTITISHPVVSQPDLSVTLSQAVQLPGQAPSLIALKGMLAEPAIKTGVKSAENDQPEPGLLDSWLVRNSPESPARKGIDAPTARNTESLREPAETSAGKESADMAASKETVRESDADDAAARSVLESLGANRPSRAHNHLARAGNETSTTNSAYHPAAVGTTLKATPAPGTEASTAAVGEAADFSRINWLHDYAMYTLPPNPTRGRLFLQLTLAPTVNYRSLSGGDFGGNKETLGGPTALVHQGSPQDWVDHSPAVGFEFGGNVLYRVTRNLTIKGGLQFNYSRYKIVAYASKPQQTTITLNTPYGYSMYMDSITAMSTASNFGGKTQETLYNDYYELSAPIGFELRVLGNERLQFNVGGTVQPSYLLNTNSYMLTADYTNYTRYPSLFRRWNISGAVEAFLSYQTGPIRWQVGPEFRYQFLSTYNGSYPINENLKGYGIKIGITKPLP
jgi:hypothetical protein